MPFDDDNNNLPKAKGVKFDNKNSMFANTVKKPTKAEADLKAKEVNDKLSDYQERAMTAALNFKKVLDDKTLQQNKNIFQQDTEKEVIANLVQLAIDMNSDPDEESCMGSVGTISLLCKCLLLQRDKINELSYNVFQMNKKISEFDKILQILSSSVPSTEKESKDD